MRILNRWVMMNKVLVISLLLLLLFAWSDSQNLIGMKQIDSEWQAAGGWSEDSNVWLIFWDTIGPAWFVMWIGVLLGVGIIWYLLTKDKSESLALFITPTILILFGVQDLLYYVFSPDTLAGTIGCWANKIPGVMITSTIMGEACPSTTAFILSGIIGVVLAYHAYKTLQKEW